jgi:putative DNA primase/helicase
MGNIADFRDSGQQSSGRGWSDQAEALTDLAFARLIVRRDVYGAYKADGGQYTAHEGLTRDIVLRHFRGEVVIGAHSTSTDGRCLTFTVDVDAHGDEADPEANWRYVQIIARRLKDLGLVALICDSNGKGGYHVRVLFKKPVPAAVAYWLGERVVADWADHGFKSAPEFFPKQPELTLAAPYGNWLRLPGRHHRRAHWTRIYDPGRNRWLEGPEAVRCLLKAAGDSPARVLAAYEAERKAREETGPAPATRAADRGGRDSRAEEATVRSALDHLPNDWADSYGGRRADTGWLGLGMALHDWDANRGLALWKEFSSRCPTKYAADVCDAKWSTFTQGGGLGIGTVFKEAERGGWVPPWRRNGANGHANGKHHPPGRGAQTVGRDRTVGSLGSLATGNHTKATKDDKTTNHTEDVEALNPDELTDEQLGLTPMSSVVAEEVVWTWPDRIPRGKITLIAGEGGLGKTFLALALAAIKSKGGCWPDRPGEPTPRGRIIYLTAEDGLEDTIRPRLDKLGADVDRIDALGTAKLPNGKLEPFTLADIGRLELVMKRRPGVEMIIIDPVTAFLGRGIDDHKNAELRALLGPLSDFAGKHRVAIVCITHFNKGSGRASSKIIGSVAYSNAARATWCVVADPEDDSRRLLLPVKNNLSPLRSGLAYTITDGVLVWEDGAVTRSVNDVLASQGAQTHQDKRDRAVAWLKDFMRDKRIPSDDVISAARSAGFGRSLIWDVKDEAFVRARKASDGWYWVLEEPQPSPAGPLGVVPRPAPEGFDPKQCSRCRKPIAGEFHTVWEGDNPRAECRECAQSLGF